MRVWRRGTLVAISAVAIGVAALIVLVLVLTNGSKSVQRVAPVARPRATPQVTQSHKVRVRRPHQTQVTQSHKPKRRHAHVHPQVKLRPWRWKPSEESVVAATKGRWLAVYKLPRAKKPVTRLHNPGSSGAPRVLLVHSWGGRWVHVYLPLRPNGSTGWVRAEAVKLLRNPYRVVVRLRTHRMYVFRGQKLFLKAKTVVGKPSTPTPKGTFFIVDLLRPPDPNGAYGPYTYDLSAHSDVLKTFAGGDGHVAIHGTNEPWLLGQSASHGCIRVSNPVIRKLERVLPLGTPVLIRP